ncbi:MAG: putative porin [Ignavibacteria bacterium]|nr:putative porin [Ignavibacteria bacterium]
MFKRLVSLLFLIFIYEQSLSNDTLKININDTLKITPSRSHGSVIDYHSIISKRDINYDNFYSTSDIIFKRNSYYKLDLGFPRHNTFFSAYSGSVRDNSVCFNGVSLSRIEYDYSEINQISPEQFENIEILEGSDAVLLTGKSVAINFQEKIYNTASPFTKFWYSQSGYELIASDGQLSKNITPKLNFVLGFSNLGADGRYTNQEIEHWQIRSTLRYNFDSLNSLSINYIFNNKKQGLNGGVDENSSNPANEFETNVLFNDFRERIYTTDLIFSVSSHSNVSHYLFNIFLSHQDNQLRFENEDKILQNKPEGKSIYNTFLYGANLLVDYRLLSFVNLMIGGKFDHSSIEKNSFTQSFEKFSGSSFIKVKMLLTNNINFSSGIRYERKFDYDLFSYAARFTYALTDSRYELDFSKFQILPNLSQGLNRESETNYLLLLNSYWNNLNIKSTIFYRRTNNPLIARLSLNKNYVIYSDDCDCNSRNSFGVSILWSAKFFNKIYLDAKIVSQYSETNSRQELYFPLFYSYFSAAYEYTVGNSILKAGLEAEIYSPIKGLYFYPISKDFVETDSEGKWLGNGLNAFAALKLGNAFLRLSFENVLGQYYYRVRNYPMLDRVFHLSVTWSFND